MSNSEFCNAKKVVNMSKTLGKKIKSLRQGKALSLDKLAEMTGSSKSYLWELENPRPGKKLIKPSAEKMVTIAHHLGVTADYLLSEEATPNDAVLRDAFFRDFQNLDTEDQKRIKDMVEAWSKKK